MWHCESEPQEDILEKQHFLLRELKIYVDFIIISSKRKTLDLNFRLQFCPVNMYM